jgi:UDP-N-acetyl-D-glucosamine dehydrogenase
MNQLLDRINKKTAIVGVIGLGYVGLELSLNITNSKYKVFGFDKNIFKIRKLKKNIPTINTVSKKRLSILNKKYLFDISDISKIHECDIIIICVPTPLKNNMSPDMFYVQNSLNLIYNYLRTEQLVILESTVYPGATRKIIYNKIIKKKSLKIGENFFLSFSPERISPGKEYDIKYSNITKVVSGFSIKCLKIANAFYEKVFTYTYQAASLETAEFTKLFENCYRSVNIGLVNQMKMISDKLGLNIHEIINAAKTKPFGFKPFAPGPGVGGHCIPIDPLFISWIAKKNGEKSDFIDLSRNINLKVTKWVINKIINHSESKKKILILGVAYKKDIDDYRESPALNIINVLKKNNFHVSYYDPYIDKVLIDKKLIFSLKKLNFKKLSDFDSVVIITDHSNIRYDLILKNSNRIFDTRGVYGKYKNSKIIHC